MEKKIVTWKLVKSDRQFVLGHGYRYQGETVNLDETTLPPNRGMWEIVPKPSEPKPEPVEEKLVLKNQKRIIKRKNLQSLKKGEK